MLIAFVLGYVFGLVFYFLFLSFLIFLASETKKPLNPVWLYVGRWMVTPVLVVLGAYIVDGELNDNSSIAFAGYAVSRGIRWIKVQLGWARSDAEILARLEDLADQHEKDRRKKQRNRR
ncbi:MAG: hypothetical protein KDA52_06875 [Planctomycetaceae bacterium]|nr:hypothetical protein [Planctomycetaceae bacterium]